MRRPLVAVLTLLAIGSLPALLGGDEEDDEIYRLTPTKDPSAPFGVYVPTGLDDSFTELKRMLHPKLIERIKAGTEKDMSGYHFGLGMWIRNNWALWKGSRLSDWFNKHQICHPDDMSGILLDSFWRRLAGRPVELEKQIAHYQEYWKKAGGDPCKKAGPDQPLKRTPAPAVRRRSVPNR